MQDDRDANKWYEFNLNDRVQVRLTQAGLRRYRQNRVYYNVNQELRYRVSLEPPLKDGYYEEKLYNIITEFGDMIREGYPPPFDYIFRIKNDPGDSCA